jgi:hypothetical protein
MDVRKIDASMLERIRSLGLPEKEDNSAYVILHVYGDGKRASSKWNAKVYRNNKGGLKLVTVDIGTLEKMLSRTPHIDKGKTIRIDDSGWGFPLGGVMIGASDDKRVETGIIDVRFFQGDLFRSKKYLKEASKVTQSLLERFEAMPQDTDIEICSGYINSASKGDLRDKGYDVKVVEIKGMLQDELEKRFKEYIKSLGYDRYYDPKASAGTGSGFEDIIKWIAEKPERKKLAKTGWKYFNE